MNSYEKYTAELDIRANNSVNVLRVLKKYRELGEVDFSRDLNSFLRLPKDSFHDKEDQDRLRNIIVDIRHDRQEYDECKEQVNDAIHEIESNHPSRGVNHFARNLYVNVLRGDGFFERYEEDVHYALEELSAPQ